MRSRLLGLPRWRWLFGYFDVAVYLCAAYGAVALYRRDRASRRLSALLLCYLVTRSLLYSFAVPHGTTQRYLVEAYPVLLALAASGIDRGLIRACLKTVARSPEREAARAPQRSVQGST
jgi:hypothetical protein